MSLSSPSSSPPSSITDWDMSSVSSFFQHIQQPQYYHQQRHYNNEDDDSPSNVYDMDGGELDDISSVPMSSQQSSTTSSPINYFFNRAVETITFANDDEKEENGLDYRYLFMNETTTSAPDVDGRDYFGGGGNNISNDMNDSASLVLENWWNVFDEQYMRHSMGWSITLLVAYAFILVIGIIGNCMVILVVVFRPQMRTVTNMFIMNLAVADLFVIVFCVPATLLANVFTPWILGSFMCKGVAYVQGVSVCASAYSLVSISLDRCKAIYRPMERPRGLSKSQALSTICLIWVIALLLTIPWAVIFNVITSDKDGLSYCIETWKNEQHGKIYFLVANLICCYCLPLILISLSNVVIWCNVARRKVPQDSASIGTIKRMHRRTRHGVRKMLGIVTLAFLLSWLPLYILVTRVKFSKNIDEDEQTLLEILLPLAQWLGSWNSSINPVLYAFLNHKFREMFKSLLPAWVPFVHRTNMRAIIRYNMGRGMDTNGTYTVGTAGSPSYSTVFTGRSSRGSGGNNAGTLPRFQSRKNYHNHKTLMVTSFRRDLPRVAVTTPTSSETNNLLALACGSGNASTIVLTTNIVTTPSSCATITDL